MPHHSPSPIDWPLLARALQAAPLSDADSAETTQLKATLAAQPATRELAEAARAEWGAQPAPRHSAQASLEALCRKIATEEHVTPVRAVRRNPFTYGWGRGERAWLRHVLGAACVVMGIVGAVVFSRSASSNPDNGATYYTTTASQTGSVTLSDGTRVVLAPESRIRLPQAYGASSRTVILEGEAYFHVVQHKGAPFIVQTGNVNTRVLGTVFTVRKYETDTHVRVAVANGKVTASGTRSAVILTSGLVGMVSDSVATISPVVADDTSWTNGKLVFRDSPVPSVLASLRRWYGYEFRVSDSTLVREQITVTFRIGRVQEMMVALTDVLDADYSLHGHTVTLTPRKRRSAVPQTSKPPDRWFIPSKELGTL